MCCRRKLISGRRRPANLARVSGRCIVRRINATTHWSACADDVRLSAVVLSVSVNPVTIKYLRRALRARARWNKPVHSRRGASRCSLQRFFPGSRSPDPVPESDRIGWETTVLYSTMYVGNVAAKRRLRDPIIKDHSAIWQPVVRGRPALWRLSLPTRTPAIIPPCPSYVLL